MPQIERIPPHNDEAEKSVLGAVLMDAEVFSDISEILKPEDFYNKAHSEIYSCMLDLFRGNEAIDVVTVSERLTKRKSLEAAGGRAYIAHLSTFVPTTANAVQYARIVEEKAVLRRLIGAAGEITEQSFSEKLDSRDVLDHAESVIYEISQNKQSSEYEDLKVILGRNIEAIQEAERNGGVLPGLSTGFKRLDEMTTGLHKGDMIIVAARPSMGKTAFVLNIAQHAALKSKARVVIFSLEMTSEQLGMRFLSMDARVDSRKLAVGDIDAEDWETVNEAAERLSNADIVIDNTPGIGVMEVRNKCRRINAKRKIDLIIIDYLQLMSGDRSSDSRQQEVTQISRYLKQLAREMDCPVIVLSQLSRAPEQRLGDHRPILSDLRESGAIEQDADAVMFLYREDYYKSPEEEKSNTCDVIIAKHRTGETGVATLVWMPKYTKFADIIKESN